MSESNAKVLSVGAKGVLRFQFEYISDSSVFLEKTWDLWLMALHGIHPHAGVIASEDYKQYMYCRKSIKSIKTRYPIAMQQPRGEGEGVSVHFQVF